jgi:hypothetical protein
MEFTGAAQATTAATPIGQAKRGPKTKQEKITAAFDRFELAVAELKLAVDVALQTDIPGFDFSKHLVSELVPVLAKIGYEPKPVRKARGTKA